jgi:hypothetical protein
MKLLPLLLMQQQPAALAVEAVVMAAAATATISLTKGLGHLPVECEGRTFGPPPVGGSELSLVPNPFFNNPNPEAPEELSQEQQERLNQQSKEPGGQQQPEQEQQQQQEEDQQPLESTLDKNSNQQ